MTRWREHSEARAEVREINRHYLKTAPPLVASQFRAARSRTLKLLKAHPEAAPIYDELESDPPIRHKNLGGVFPYSVYYVKHQSDYVILAYAHHSRRLGYWATRLDTVEEPTQAKKS